jgi:allophanate hydrolase subunit 1
VWTADKESLCSSHDTIKYWANDIKKKLKKAIKTEDYSNIKDLIPTLNDLLAETRLAKKKGARMEARLIDYYRAITGLNFVRKGRDK